MIRGYDEFSFTSNANKLTKMLNILYLYNSTQTYTNTVHEHLACMDKYSQHRFFYAHLDEYTNFNLNLSRFDVVGIHFSVRLPFDQISPTAEKSLKEFKGLKFLFIQDEYNNTHRAWEWIQKLGLNLVFSVVPQIGMERIYPRLQFDSTRFVSVLTGYVPDTLQIEGLCPPSERSIIVGYRGRPLPIQYGQLGQDKVAIGRQVKKYLDSHNVANDIAWSEEDRIYGSKWYVFMASCRSMLGSESGSNVFDWDGTLSHQIEEFRLANPAANDLEIYEKIIKPREIHEIMNQISPRVFEAIAARTVLVLFEGKYSDVILPGVHYISLRKDGSNLPEVLELLKDAQYVDQMAERAWQDVIASGKYSYRSFVQLVDKEIEESFSKLEMVRTSSNSRLVIPESFAVPESEFTLTTSPIRAVPPSLIVQVTPCNEPQTIFFKMKRLVICYSRHYAGLLWIKLPKFVREFLKPRIMRVFKID